jgi:hypothetical protein
MATKANDAITAAPRKIGVLRLALTGALSATIFYVFCWIGAQTPLGPGGHMYLNLYTAADLSTGASLIEGAAWSFGGGLIFGALIAYVYNALAAFDRS